MFSDRPTHNVAVGRSNVIPALSGPSTGRQRQRARLSSSSGDRRSRQEASLALARADDVAAFFDS